jgi:anaphase-promoting complex subunit 11
MKVKLLHYKAVASWSWKGIPPNASCSICQLPFEASCQHCTLPGPSCPPTKAPNCSHWFHLHCIQSWLGEKVTEEQKVCPNCRSSWSQQQPQTQQSEEANQGWFLCNFPLPVWDLIISLKLWVVNMNSDTMFLSIVPDCQNRLTQPKTQFSSHLLSTLEMGQLCEPEQPLEPERNHLMLLIVEWFLQQKVLLIPGRSFLSWIRWELIWVCINLNTDYISSYNAALVHKLVTNLVPFSNQHSPMDKCQSPCRSQWLRLNKWGTDEYEWKWSRWGGLIELKLCEQPTWCFAGKVSDRRSNVAETNQEVVKQNKKSLNLEILICRRYR